MKITYSVILLATWQPAYLTAAHWCYANYSKMA